MDDMLRRQDEIEVCCPDLPISGHSNSRAPIRQIVTTALALFTRILLPLRISYGSSMPIGFHMENYS